MNTPDSIPSYAELASENVLLKGGMPVGKRATMYVMAILFLCTLTVCGVLGVILLRPDKDNTAILATIVGITSPVLVALLAASVQQVHHAVNSRLSQLLELTAASAKAKGVLQEKEKAEDIRSKS